MSKKDYGWKRFWCPREGTINLDHHGYLYDPDAEGGKAYNPELVTLEAIADIPCLVLLGEPGIGKSQELEKLRNYTEEVVNEDDRILSLDLEDCSESKLYANLFNSQTFIDWINGTHKLYLFLDSLDQGWLTIQRLPTLLVEEFRQLDKVTEIKPNLLFFLALKTGFFGKDAKIKDRPNLSRLYLRLVCRVFPFLQAEDSFRNLWSKHYSSYYLMPLSESDIRTAFNENRLDADQCWQEIIDKGLLPLAIKPISLQFLIKKLQRNNGKLPQNQSLVDIYLDGCRELCREPKDEARHPSKPVSSLEVDQRLSIAARIAAVMTFCLRATVWTGQSFGDYAPNTDIRAGELCGQCESTNGEKGLKITSNFIQEVLDTALFSDRVSNRMGWAHQTYAEFLAAWYLIQHEVSLERIRKLIFSSKGSEHKLIPQLYDTALWMARMRLVILQEIIKTDPDFLVQTDLLADEEIRASIVDSLLTQYEEGKLFDRGRNNYRHYAKLKHPGLVEQLRPYIRDPNKQIDARDLAIDIAEVCEVSELQEELAKLTLDSSQSIHLRVSAAKAICSVGDATIRLKLRPLVTEQLPEDEDDRLKGFALKALWSGHLSVTELFSSLTRPKKRNLIGSYHIFIEYELVPKLQPNDLAIALNWLAKQGIRCFGHPFENLGNKILLKAWESFDFSGIAESFAKIALVQWKEYQSLITRDSKLQQQFALSLLSETEKRHALIEQIVSILSEAEEDPIFLFSSPTENIVISEDIFWMLERLQNSNSEKAQKIWSQLLQRSFNRQDAKQIDAIVVASQTNNILQEVFAPFFAPIELNSIQAGNLRADYFRMQEFQERRQNHPLLDPPPKERVLQLLEKLEAGNLSAWWQLNMEMTLKPESQYYDNEFELDLTQLPGWQEADETTRRRIIKGAEKYIQQQDDIDYGWIGTNTFDRPALAGCRALQLLLIESLDFLSSLPSEIWQRWASVIVAAPSSNQHEDSYLELVKYAYLNASEEFIKTLIALINKENQEHDYLSVIDRLDKCWDKQLKLTLLDKAQDPLLKPKCIGQLLEELLKQGLAEAGGFARSLITLPLSLDENEREKALISARVLIENSESSSWSFIWALIQQDSLFGREVLELTAYRYSHGIHINLTEVQLADLYIWLVHEYPYDEDPDHSNEVMAYSVTARDGIARLRDSVLSQLRERGTLEACAEIERLIQELPDITWFGKTLIDAQANMRRKTWRPPTPEEFLQFVISQEPSNLDLSNQLNVIEMRTKKMEDEIKTENNFNISNSHINAPIGTSGVTKNQVTITNFDAKNGINWGNWLAVIGILVAIIAIPLSMSVSGAFNEEFKQWFKHIFPSKVEQQLTPKSQ